MDTSGGGRDGEGSGGMGSRRAGVGSAGSGGTDSPTAIPDDTSSDAPASGEAASGATGPNMRDLIGEPVETALKRLGPPAADQRVGQDRWLRFAGPGWSLRLRARPAPKDGSADEPALVRSWTVTLERGLPGVGDAMRFVGLSPPDPGPERIPLRLPLRDSRQRVHSLTAAVRGGRIRAVSAFDEPPDWPGAESR